MIGALSAQVVLASVLAATSEFRHEYLNVLLIMADDVGVETLGCYGGQSYKTPRLDELAAGGMRFTHCYAMPVCHPTRVCLMTGQYPFRLKHPKWGSFPKAAERRTFGHVMKNAGYATAVAGKWQLSLMKNDLQQPRRMGFDEWCLFGWHEGPRYWQPMLYQNGKLRDDVKDRYGPAVYCEFLIDFLKRNRDKPFFAYYPMALCHDVTDDLNKPVPYAPGKDRYESYAEMIEQMDKHVGMLVDALDRLKLRDKTLILFTGDNGTSKSSLIRAENGKYIREPVYSMINGRKVRGGKGDLTNAGTNVPLIANLPGKVAKGTVVDDLVDMSDFLPTLAELGDFTDLPAVPAIAPVSLDGVSFAPRLRGKAKPRRWAFSEGRGGKYWVRDQQWKLYGDGRLFDIKADPEEKRPILTGKEPSRDAAAARERLKAVQGKLGYSR